MKELIKSFGFAFQGVFTAITKERNMRIHIVCMIYMFFFLFAFDFFEVTRTQTAILFIACGLVIGSELINTAIEAVVDLHGKEHTQYGKIAKDCAAGSVLIFAIFSVLCGIAIMYQPTAFALLFEYFIANPVAIVLFAISVVIFTIFIFKGIPFKGKENK
ncbi:MAG: diacylglycerol kinase family protein [Clostridia bacterium]|nr:diacylglycerol kinase family protein [Clostridia bacterium]